MNQNHPDLLNAPEPVRLPGDHADNEQALAAGADPFDVAARDPSRSLAWARLAEDQILENRSRAAVTTYAYARVGYHRGLDALRRAGWRGRGPVPVDHEPNQGFLRSVLALAEAAAYLGELDEAERCETFLRECGTSADEVRALRRPGAAVRE